MNQRTWPPRLDARPFPVLDRDNIAVKVAGGLRAFLVKTAAPKGEEDTNVIAKAPGNSVHQFERTVLPD